MSENTQEEIKLKNGEKDLLLKYQKDKEGFLRIISINGENLNIQFEAGKILRIENEKLIVDFDEEGNKNITEKY